MDLNNVMVVVGNNDDDDVLNYIELEEDLR
jgi:hypothetical protein